MFSRKKLDQLVDSAAIEAAIKAAETETSGEIRVSVSSLFWGDVQKWAQKAFERLGMSNTKDRNGVLFFIVPSRRKFVILGDEGIHRKVGQDFWHSTAALMSGKFKTGDFTGGIIAGIQEVARQLKDFFPYQGTADVNELPDAVDFDERGRR